MSEDTRYGCTRQPFASELLASNWAKLHRLARPECSSAIAYPCTRLEEDGSPACPPGTWHVGHSDKAQSKACRAAGYLGVDQARPLPRKHHGIAAYEVRRSRRKLRRGRRPTLRDANPLDPPGVG